MSWIITLPAGALFAIVYFYRTVYRLVPSDKPLDNTNVSLGLT